MANLELSSGEPFGSNQNPDQPARETPLNTVGELAAATNQLGSLDPAALLPTHFIRRGENVYVPLIALDELPEFIYVNIPQSFTQAEVEELHGMIFFGPKPTRKYQVRVAANALIEGSTRNDRSVHVCLIKFRGERS
jgi:hypothetical protein